MNLACHMFASSLNIKQFYLSHWEYSFRCYHSGPEWTRGDGNEEVLCILQTFRITGASTSDCTNSLSGHSMGVGGGGLTPLQRCKWCIPQPQLNGLKILNLNEDVCTAVEQHIIKWCCLNQILNIFDQQSNISNRIPQMCHPPYSSDLVLMSHSIVQVFHPSDSPNLVFGKTQYCASVSPSWLTKSSFWQNTVLCKCFTLLNHQI